MPFSNEIAFQAPRVHWAARIEAGADGERFEDTSRETNLVFVQAGEIQTRIGDVSLVARADALLIYPPKTRFMEQIAGGTRYHRVFFVPGSQSFDDSLRMLQLSPSEMLARWMDDLCALHEAHDSHRDLSGALLQAIVVRLRHIEQRQQAERRFHPGVLAAMKYLQENPASPVTLPQLAQVAHLSAGHLRTLFAREVGSSPLKYQNDLRMQRALRLLEESHLTLSQIARACGFDDAEYFARRFRQYHRLPPGQLRRKRFGRN